MNALSGWINREGEGSQKDLNQIGSSKKSPAKLELSSQALPEVPIDAEVAGLIASMPYVHKALGNHSIVASDNDMNLVSIARLKDGSSEVVTLRNELNDEGNLVSDYRVIPARSPSEKA